MNTRTLLSVLVAAAVAAGAAHAVGLPPERLIELPGIRSMLPPGTIAGAADNGSPVLVRAEGLRTGSAASPLLRVALVVVGAAHRESLKASAAVTREVTLIVARQAGPSMVPELVTKRIAYGVHSVVLAVCRSGSQPAVAIQWAQSVFNHHGDLEVWALGEAKPRLAWSGEAEGFYFDPPGAAPSRMILYCPESDSLVCLPQVLEWRGDRLAASSGDPGGLATRLMADYASVLDGYRSSGRAGEAPRMLVDVALSKGRLLERMGNLEGAVAAYRELASMVPDELSGRTSPEDHRDNLLRLEEANRRAAAIETARGGQGR